jgi:DNA-binding CsgD family transcriptional regulator
MRSDNHDIYEDDYYPVIYVKDYFYRNSPLLNEAISSSKTVLKIGDSISSRDWEMTDIYNNFIAPQQLYWELFVTLRWKNNLEGMITLWRSKQKPNFDGRDISKAEILAPHLMTSINNIRLISQFDAWKNRLTSADEVNNKGLLWLDHKLKPCHFNAKARDICLQLYSEMPYDMFNLDKGEFPIPSCVFKDCSGLVYSPGTKKHSIVLPKVRTISIKGGMKFRTECSLIWKANQVSSTPNFIVTLSCVPDKTKQQNTLKSGLHLSEREMDILYYLVGGLSEEKIAQKLYISRQTVHTHIKNIYKKLGATSRIELYRRVIEGNSTELHSSNPAARDMPESLSLK